MGLVIGDLKKQTNINKQVTSEACNCEETIECNRKGESRGKGVTLLFRDQVVTIHREQNRYFTKTKGE